MERAEWSRPRRSRWMGWLREKGCAERGAGEHTEPWEHGRETEAAAETGREGSLPPGKDWRYLHPNPIQEVFIPMVIRELRDQLDTQQSGKEIPSMSSTWRSGPQHATPAPCQRAELGGKALNVDTSSPTWNKDIPGRNGRGGDAQAALGAHQYQVTARTEVKLWANPATNYPGDAELEPSPFLWEAAPGPARPIPLPKAMEREQG